LLYSVAKENESLRFCVCLQRAMRPDHNQLTLRVLVAVAGRFSQTGLACSASHGGRGAARRCAVEPRGSFYPVVLEHAGALAESSSPLSLLKAPDDV